MFQGHKCVGAAAAVVLGLSAAARGEIKFNEFMINPPGADNGLEWFEIINTAGGAASLTGLSVLNIEGDGTAAGLIDKIVSLDGHSTGLNGLFLWRDASTEIAPGPEAATIVHVEDFNPDWENPTGTFLLVSGFSGALNDDLDTDNDGVLDSTPWTSVLDGFSFRDDGTGDRMYAGQLGFPEFIGAAANAAGALEAYVRGPEGTAHGVGVAGNPTDGYVVDDGNLPIGYQITPGSANPEVPEPASLSLLAISALAGLRRRRK